MSNRNSKLRLQKSGLRVLNESESQLVAGASATVPFTYDMGDCLHTYVCPTQMNCTGGGGGGGGASQVCTQGIDCVRPDPVHPE